MFDVDSNLQDWSERSMESLTKNIHAARVVDIRLSTVPADHLQLVQEFEPLLRWLRVTFFTDSDFKASIEMALGKSETECPFELWVDGRVDEQTLSQLAATRRRLYAYISRDEELSSSVEKVLDFAEKLDIEDVEHMRGILTHLSSLLQPLSELVDPIGDATTGQLLKLLSPACQARWVVQCAWQSSTSVLKVVYQLKSRQGKVLMQERSLQDLEEFNASALLRDGDSGVERPQHVQQFVEQFHWAKMLHQSLELLQTAGHPHYMAYSYEFDLCLSTESLQRLAFGARDACKQWLTTLQGLRLEYPTLSFFRVHQLRCYLHELGENRLGTAAAQDALHAIDTASGFELDRVEAFGTAVLKSWRSQGQAVEADRATFTSTVVHSVREAEESRAKAKPSAFKLMRRLATALEAACALVQLRLRSLSFDTAVEPLKPHLRLITVDTAEEAYTTVIGEYVQAGHFPEARTLLLLGEESDEMDLELFVGRWSSSQLLPIGLDCTQDLHVLVALHASSDLQTAAARLINDARPRAQAPLLIVSGSASTHQLSALFSFAQSNRKMLHPDTLKKALAELSEGHSCGVQFVVSPAGPGVGKSFSIRSQARQQGEVYHHRAMVETDNLTVATAGNLAKFNCEQPTSMALIHLDVNVQPKQLNEVERLLFGLLMTGRIGAGQTIAFWNAASTSLAIELANSPASRQACLHRLFPCRTMAYSTTSLKIDAEPLMHGMLRHHFLDPQAHDGADASTRICTVGAVLHRLNGKQYKSFDASKPLEPLDPENFEGAQVLTLVKEYCAEAEVLGLSSLWAFVNVAFGLLTQVMDKAGVLSSLHGSPDARERAAEVIMFVLKTAKEIALRQDVSISVGNSSTIRVR